MIGDKPTNTDPVQKLRAALHAKAKSAPNFRFYSLYDKVYRRDVLEAAWMQCRANGGAPGVDSQSFDDIEKYGLGRWLDELTEELRTKPTPRRSRPCIGTPVAGFVGGCAGNSRSMGRDTASIPTAIWSVSLDC